ncbi:MAG: hypothetical protein WCX69_04780, partial [Candidatus Paceibacterota bacterium]
MKKIFGLVSAICLVGILFFNAPTINAQSGGVVGDSPALSQSMIAELHAQIKLIQQQITLLQQRLNLILKQTLPQSNNRLAVLNCSDGTARGQCSKTQPKYCSNGILNDNCAKCGCNPDEESFCDTAGKICQGAVECSDSTLGGQCSVTYKGWYCQKGNLVGNCRLCGCDAGSV